MSPEMQYGEKYADKAALFRDSENGAVDERLNLNPYIDFGQVGGGLRSRIPEEGRNPCNSDSGYTG